MTMKRLMTLAQFREQHFAKGSAPYMDQQVNVSFCNW